MPRATRNRYKDAADVSEPIDSENRGEREKKGRRCLEGRGVRDERKSRQESGTGESLFFIPCAANEAPAAPGSGSIVEATLATTPLGCISTCLVSWARPPSRPRCVHWGTGTLRASGSFVFAVSIQRQAVRFADDARISLNVLLQWHGSTCRAGAPRGAPIG